MIRNSVVSLLLLVYSHSGMIGLANGQSLGNDSFSFQMLLLCNTGQVTGELGLTTEQRAVLADKEKLMRADLTSKSHAIMLNRELAKAEVEEQLNEVLDEINTSTAGILREVLEPEQMTVLTRRLFLDMVLSQGMVAFLEQKDVANYLKLEPTKRSGVLETAATMDAEISKLILETRLKQLKKLSKSVGPEQKKRIERILATLESN